VACQIIPCIYPALEFLWCILSDILIATLSRLLSTTLNCYYQDEPSNAGRMVFMLRDRVHPTQSRPQRLDRQVKVSMDMLEKRIRGPYPKVNNRL
jgi:hypothetical protein